MGAGADGGIGDLGLGVERGVRVRRLGTPGLRASRFGPRVSPWGVRCERLIGLLFVAEGFGGLDGCGSAGGDEGGERGDG